MGEFDGAGVIVTGGVRGQGRAHVERFLGEGATVAVLDVVDGAALTRELGPRVGWFPLDVADHDAWNAVMPSVMSWLGRLDVLVNNAGIFGAHPSPLLGRDVTNWRRLLEVNVLGAAYGIAVAAPFIAESGAGAIVNTSSTKGVRGSATSPMYSASKFAIRGLTKSAAVELAPHGIRVNAVLPGVIATDMTLGRGQDEVDMVRAAAPHLLIKRIGRPDDVAEAVIFLASERSSYLTGVDLVVDGGWLEA